MTFPRATHLRDLLIFDEALPAAFSPFRTVEYLHHLSFFDAELITLEGWLLGISNRSVDEQRAALDADPTLKRAMRTMEESWSTAGRLAYVTFLNAADRILDHLHLRQLPFILQLYPGGGFALQDRDSDDKLKRIVASPLCRRIIVTQPVTRDYLVLNLGVARSRLAYIYGGVFDSHTAFDFHVDKRRYGRDKSTLDVCFVAHKYGNDLEAKGFSRFATVGARLLERFPDLRLHVVGGWAPGDLPVPLPPERITFHGVQPSGFFAGFYPSMDMIVSLNEPSKLSPGSFDGFPTGSCIEAGFHGVANCVTDPLGLNEVFNHLQDILIARGDDDQVTELIATHLGDPQRLEALAYANWRRFHEVFDVDRQLWARTRIIVDELTRYDGIVNSAVITPGAIRTQILSQGLRATITEQQKMLEGNGAQIESYRRTIEAYLDGIRQLEGSLQDGNRYARQLEAGIGQLQERVESDSRRIRTLEADLAAADQYARRLEQRINELATAPAGAHQAG